MSIIKSIKFQWDKFVFFIVIISLIHLILETTPGFLEKNHFFLFLLDGIITTVFIIDLFVKLNRNILSKEFNFSTELWFELLIDLISILPFFITIIFPGLKFIAIIRLLRLVRVFKLMSHLKSNVLILNAVKNKKNELYISVQVVLIITVILSAILYFVENPSQPQNFSSITDSFLWSISKFIGEIGGYGDFAPITIAGKILATFVGILGIAIFAVPAGIIASGFVEEIELVKRNKELDDVYNTLSKAFQFDILSGQRSKSEIGLEHARRRFISIVDAVVKLNKAEGDIFEVCGLNKNLKLSKRLKKSGDEEVLIEYYENNSIYGTYINRNSKITIVSPHSNDSFNLGHYSYCLAEILNANYISVEKYGIYSFLEETNINFNENDNYLKNIEAVNNDVIKQFIKDASDLISKDSYVFNIGSSMGDSPSYHILTGGKKGDIGIIHKGTFSKTDCAEKMHNQLIEKSSVSELDVTTHTHYSTNNSNHLDWFIALKLKANAMSIKVNVELMKGSNEKYYESIGILSDSIKESLS
jgi:voltage-gated potassium channel